MFLENSLEATINNKMYEFPDVFMYLVRKNVDANITVKKVHDISIKIHVVLKRCMERLDEITRTPGFSWDEMLLMENVKKDAELRIEEILLCLPRR